MTPEEAHQNLIPAGWSEQSIAIWVRAHVRCEYYNCDLLAEAGLHFHGYHVDHIVPKGGDGLDNLALACAPCNRTKRAKAFETEGETLSREDRIERANNYIRGIRARNEERLSQSMGWLKICGLLRP